MNDATDSPRWIADVETLVLFERQPDLSYRAAYRMTPISERGTDVDLPAGS